MATRARELNRRWFIAGASAGMLGILSGAFALLVVAAVDAAALRDATTIAAAAFLGAVLAMLMTMLLFGSVQSWWHSTSGPPSGAVQPRDAHFTRVLAALTPH